MKNKFYVMLLFLALTSCGKDHMFTKDIEGKWRMVTSTEPGFSAFSSLEYSFDKCEKSNTKCTGIKLTMVIDSLGNTTSSETGFTWFIGNENLNIMFDSSLTLYYTIESLTENAMHWKNYFSDDTYDLQRIN